MAAKKTKKPADPPPAAPDSATYTWEAVLAAVPAPTDDQRALYTVAASPADLVESGARIRSEKILTDLLRFAGTVSEFLPKATKEQRGLLLGFSEGFFRVFVHEGDNLRGMAGQRSDATAEREAKRSADVTIASKSYADGLHERTGLVNALEGVEPYDASLGVRIDAARGRVVDGASLSKSLLALVKLVRAVLKNKKSVVARQLVDGGVTDEGLTRVEELAAEVKKAGAQASGARTKGLVSQADLDRQDGVCLLHMGRLMRIFNGAHERDPAIVQLTPIATRQIFAPVRKRIPAKPAPAKSAAVPA